MSRRLATRHRGASFLVAVLATATALAGCADSDGTDSTKDATARRLVADFSCPARATSAGSTAHPVTGRRLRVATTVAPITSIVANIAGDHADVVGLVPEGTNSHTFEPKPSAARTLSDRDVVFLNGLTLEEPTRDLAEANRRATTQIVQLGDLALPADARLYDFSFPRAGGKPNPHLWTNPPMARCYAETVASVLAKADPTNADAYRRNLATYVAKIDDLDRRMQTATTTVPEAHRRLLTYHDAYAYFAVHYGWQVIGAVQPSDFEDPSPKEVARLIDQVRDEQVPAVFGSEVFPSDVLARIAKEGGARYVDVLRDDDLPGAPGDDEHSYLGLMRFDFVTMVTALGGDAAALEAFDPSDTAPDRATYPQ